MHRKIFGICTALMALGAFAIAPAMASAAPTLTENGKALAAGSLVTGFGQGTVTFTASSIVVTCNDYWITGEVHTNSDTNGMKVTVTKATFRDEVAGVTKDCTSNQISSEVQVTTFLTNDGGTRHWCIIANEATDIGKINGKGCTDEGPLAITLALNFTGVLTCKFTKAEALVTFSTTTSPAPVTLASEQEWIGEGKGNSFLCPVRLAFKGMSFKLYTDTATESESTADPLTLS